MNNVVLVGRLTSNPEVTKTENGNQVTYVNVAVTRNYKNVDGIYETDFIRCILWNEIAANTTEYCKVGDVIGIKGRLQSSSYDDENGKRHFVTDVVAERITFLSSAKPKEDEKPKSSKKKKADE
jgi:single-strand DNA-binding protein